MSLTWSDGRRSIFHYIWLRDNCTCRHCGDRSGGHRYLELNDVDAEIAPAKISLSADGSLIIEWQGDNHVTQYSPTWLRAHCYSVEARTERQHKPVLWDAALSGKSPLWNYPDISQDKKVRFRMFEQIRDYGFAFISNVPAEENEIARLAGLFGFVRQTHYGQIFDLISTPQKRILAHTSHAIRPHNDELFQDPPPGMLIMHCLRPSGCGGGASILTDGFNVAEKLRTQDADAFDILTTTPVTHRRDLVDEVDDVALQATWRTIELDQHRNIIAFRFNERTMAPFDVPEEQVEPLYRAMKTLSTLLYKKDASVVHRLESGQTVVFDNYRVLHAREAFSGARHIRQCHVDRDEFFNRLGVLNRSTLA